MDNISVFVKTIIVISFMWCIAEMIMPDNSTQKYSSFIYGLIVISLTVSAFTKLNFNDFYTQINVDKNTEYNTAYIKTVYKNKLEDILSEKFDDHSISVELDDEYKIKSIDCDNQKTYDDIMRYLNEQ
ncbi:MAG: stage III sporulation protein AF [Clostridia bacterium]|nr:stage III sporulation protein AF [Clostridia bacterium]